MKTLSFLCLRILLAGAPALASAQGAASLAASNTASLGASLSAPGQSNSLNAAGNFNALRSSSASVAHPISPRSTPVRLAPRLGGAGDLSRLSTQNIASTFGRFNYSPAISTAALTPVVGTDYGKVKGAGGNAGGSSFDTDLFGLEHRGSVTPAPTSSHGVVHGPPTHNPSTHASHSAPSSHTFSPPPHP